MNNLDRILAARTAPEILEALSRACWHNAHDGTDCPDDAILTPEAVWSAWPAAFLLAFGEVSDAMAALEDLTPRRQPGEWRPQPRRAMTDDRLAPDAPDIRYRHGRDTAGGMLFAGDGAALESVHRLWSELPDPRPRHPFAPLVAAWQASLPCADDAALFEVARGIDSKADAPTCATWAEWLPECTSDAMRVATARLTALLQRAGVLAVHDPAEWTVMEIRSASAASRYLYASVDGKTISIGSVHRLAKCHPDLPDPIEPLVRAWQIQANPPDKRHLIVLSNEPQPLARSPALVSFLGRPLDETKIEAIDVDGSFASRFADGFERAGYRAPSKTQGELLPGPRTLNGERIDDIVIAALVDAPLTGDERSTLRGDIAKLAKAAYALTGAVTITEAEAAIFVGGRNTEANRRRAYIAARTGGGLLVTINQRTLAARDLMVTSFHAGGFDLAPPSWWVKDPVAWRLTGGLFRPVSLGFETTKRGTDAGYWGGLHRTIDGLESALTWGSTAGRGKHGRIPDNLRPERKGGPGPETFFPWYAVLRCAGEPVSDEVIEAKKGPEVTRYNRRIEALIGSDGKSGAGYGIPLDAKGNPTMKAASVGDTIEIRRIKGGGRGRKAGIMVRASARFCEAFARGQRRDNWERLPARRLFRE